MIRRNKNVFFRRDTISVSFFFQWITIFKKSKNILLNYKVINNVSIPESTPLFRSCFHSQLSSLHSYLCRPSSQILATLLAVQTQFTNPRYPPSCADPVHKFSLHSYLCRPSSQILATLLVVQVQFTNPRYTPSCAGPVYKFSLHS